MSTSYLYLWPAMGSRAFSLQRTVRLGSREAGRVCMLQYSIEVTLRTRAEKTKVFRREKLLTRSFSFFFFDDVI